MAQQQYTKDTSLYVVYAPRDPPWPYRALLSQQCYVVAAESMDARRWPHYTHPLRRPWARDADADHDKYLFFHPSMVGVWVRQASDAVPRYQERLCQAGESVEELHRANKGTKIPLHVLLYYSPVQQ